MQFIGTGDRILTENFNVGYLYTITFKTGIYINSACIGIGDNFVMFQKAEPDLLFTLNVDTADEVDTIELYVSGTNNYDDLVNRPQINSYTLTGNMSSSDLGLQDTISDLDTIRAGAAAGATAVQPADMTSALAAKQDALNAAQLNAVNSGITSTDVAQIETNKNNILLNTKNGKANYINTPDVTISGAGYVHNNLACNIPVGNYYLKYTSTQGISGNAETIIRDSDNNIICDITETSITGNNIIPFTLSSVGATFTLFSVRAGTYSNFMIIPKSLYDAGFTDYQPYAMSNVELTAKEQANESNILSLLPTSYSLPTLIDDTTCTINDGGYITVGNIIIVNITFTTSVSYTAYSSIMQFPVPKNSGSITMVAAAHIDSSVNVAVNKYGQIALFDTPLPAGTYHFFTVYLRQ